MVLWIFGTYDTRIFCYVIYLTLLWANEPIQGLACHIEATVFSEPGCYKKYKKIGVSRTFCFHHFYLFKDELCRFLFSPKNFLLTKPLHKLNDNISVSKNNK